MRLSPGDLERWQNAILALHRLQTTDDFDRALPEILLRLISADCFFLLEYDVTPKLDGARKADPNQCVSPEMVRYTERVFFAHPFSQYLMRTSGVTPLKISDFYNRRQFRGAKVFQNFYRTLEMDGLMAAVLFGPKPGFAACFYLARQRDFTGRDRLLLKLLRPHVQLARRNAERWTAWTRSNRSRDFSRAMELTPRETEIARWLAAGKTNPEIAAILESRPRTVEKHVERILHKLRVENRTAAAVMLAGSAKSSAGR